MNKKKIMTDVETLITMYKENKLGGEIMPEDANPHLELSSKENYLYYTLPMALNYQRNSYTLWEAALKTYNDPETKFIFNPKECLDHEFNEVRDFIQKENRKKFPYLAGTKICNYWLYVIYQYTDKRYKNIEDLTVAPDTHVCKATYKLGLITEEEFNSSNVQLITIERWQELFQGTKYCPIDIHTPLWLWSRNGFKELER